MRSGNSFLGSVCPCSTSRESQCVGLSSCRLAHPPGRTASSRTPRCPCSGHKHNLVCSVLPRGCSASSKPIRMCTAAFEQVEITQIKHTQFFGEVARGDKQTRGNDICMVTGMTVRWRGDRKSRQCTGKRLPRTIWSFFNKEESVVCV